MNEKYVNVEFIENGEAVKFKGQAVKEVSKDLFLVIRLSDKKGFHCSASEITPAETSS